MISLKPKTFTYRGTFTNPNIGGVDTHTINHNLGCEFLDFFATVKIPDGRHVVMPDQEYAGSHYRGGYIVLSANKMSSVYTCYLVPFLSPLETAELIIVLTER